MKIYCLRHGLTELNKQGKVNGQIDEPLAPEGIKQAEAAISLIPESIKHIYTSPMLRTRHTAEIINSRLKHPLYVAEEIREIHMGQLAGKAWEEMPDGLALKKKHRLIQFDYRSYGGETAPEVKARVLSFLRKIKNKHQDGEVLIIAHGGIIRTLHFLNGQVLDVDKIVENATLITFDI